MWSEQGGGDAAGTAPVRLFSLAWLAGEHIQQDSSHALIPEAEAQHKVLDKSLSAMDDSAYTAWLATLRAAAGWQAEHLSLDVVLSRTADKLQHQVISREFVAKWPHWQRVSRAGSSVHPAVCTTWQPQHTQHCLQADDNAHRRLQHFFTATGSLSMLQNCAAAAFTAARRVDAPAVAYAVAGRAAVALLSAAGAAPALEAAESFEAATWALHRTGQLHQLHSRRSYPAYSKVPFFQRIQATMGWVLLTLAVAYAPLHALQGTSNTHPADLSPSGWHWAKRVLHALGFARGCLVLLASTTLLVNLGDAILEYARHAYFVLCGSAGRKRSPPAGAAGHSKLQWLYASLKRVLIAAGRTAVLLALIVLAYSALELHAVDAATTALVLWLTVSGPLTLAVMGQVMSQATSAQRAGMAAVLCLCSLGLAGVVALVVGDWKMVAFFALPGATLLLTTCDSGLAAVLQRQQRSERTWVLTGPITGPLWNLFGAALSPLYGLMAAPLAVFAADAIGMVAVAACIAAYRSGAVHFWTEETLSATQFLLYAQKTVAPWAVSSTHTPPSNV